MESHQNGLRRGGSRVAFVMDSGRRMRFWLDKWCGDEALRDALPSLFALASSKEAWAKEFEVILPRRGMHC